MKYPALDVAGADWDLLLACVDDFSVSAVEDHDTSVTVYFSDPASRDDARLAVERNFPSAAVTLRDVDDENWAARSQANLGAIRVGRIVVAPPWDVAPSPTDSDRLQVDALQADYFQIIITPSMGFGTGHHATTRLCLAALQTLNLEGRTVLDVGTGSGVLAIAARALGAAQATGIDSDADAVQSARENLAQNPAIAGVRFIHRDLRVTALPPADVVTANLTGALLIQSAGLLLDALRPGGTLIVSGLEAHEGPAVAAAFARARLTWQAEEDSWVGLAFNRGATIEV